MNITSLQTLISILDTGSLVKASRQLNVTQSTVTARLQQLEMECGQQLLYRQKSGVVATPAGVKLLQYARTMIGLWKQAKQEVSLPNGVESLCNFICHHDLWHDLGESLLKRLNQYYPRMAFSVRRGNEHNMQQWVSQQLMDVALTYSLPTSDNQSIHPFYTEDILLYATQIDTSIRGDQNYVYVDHGQEFMHKHTATYADAGVARVNFDSVEWAINYLLAHQGSAYLPKRVAQAYVDKGQLFQLVEAPSFTRKVYLVMNNLSTGTWSRLTEYVNQADWQVK